MPENGHRDTAEHPREGSPQIGRIVGGFTPLRQLKMHTLVTRMAHGRDGPSLPRGVRGHHTSRVRAGCPSLLRADRW